MSEDSRALDNLLGAVLSNDDPPAELLARYVEDPNSLSPAERKQIERYQAEAPLASAQIRALRTLRSKLEESRREAGQGGGAGQGEEAVRGGAPDQAGASARTGTGGGDQAGAWDPGERSQVRSPSPSRVAPRRRFGARMGLAAGVAAAAALLFFLNSGRESDLEVRDQVAQRTPDSRTSGPQSSDPQSPEIQSEEIQVADSEGARSLPVDAPTLELADGSNGATPDRDREAPESSVGEPIEPIEPIELAEVAPPSQPEGAAPSAEQSSEVPTPLEPTTQVARAEPTPAESAAESAPESEADSERSPADSSEPANKVRAEIVVAQLLRIDRAEAAAAIDLDVPFESASGELTPAGRQVLDEVGRALRDERLASDRFVLEVHTDDRGPADENLRVSEQRAQVAVAYLREQFEIAPEQLSGVGRGEQEPVVSGTTETVRAINRRVTLKRLPSAR